MRLPKGLLTQDRLKELLRYVPETGEFYWTFPSHGHADGALAGCSRPDGYRVICVEGRLYRAARLAWLYMTGNFPPEMIDHKNRNRGDDRIANLRAATRSQNFQNRTASKRNKAGLKGVSWRRGKKKQWEAQIKVGGKRMHLGVFANKRDAKEKYNQAAKQYFGEWARS